MFKSFYCVRPNLWYTFDEERALEGLREIIGPIRNERECLPISSHSQWFLPIPIPDPMFSLALFPFPFHSHWLFPFLSAPIPILLAVSRSDNK